MVVSVFNASFARRFLLACSALVPLVAGSFAQAQTAVPAAEATTASASSRDAAVLERLAEVGRTLRSLKHFTVKADAVTDEVLQSGQKLQFASTLEYRVIAPDRLNARVRTDRRHRDFYFDGKTLTLAAPRVGYYASVPLPGILSEAMTHVAERYGIEMPLADLFLWGTPAGGLDDVTAAIQVGPAQINGVSADHFALRQPGVDWQVWVQRGARALPLKVVITTTDEPALPQYAATLKWTLDTPPAASSFSFVPAKGMNRIELKSVAAAK
jgi:hypothetical protein